MSEEIRKLTGNDLQALAGLLRVYEVAFEMPNFVLPSADYLKYLLGNDYIIFFCAFHEKEVVGGLTAYILPSAYNPATEVYIYDLAVTPSFQRRGVGRRLLEALKEYCRAKGYREIYVQADRGDQHALDFYRATGGAPQSVVHFVYPLFGSADNE